MEYKLTYVFTPEKYLQWLDGKTLIDIKDYLAQVVFYNNKKYYYVYCNEPTIDTRKID